ncbi:MAG: LysR substrate-binding domain-containing protein [Pseudomonadota bacterium]
MNALTRQLKYILAAAREGSISAAAEAESISPSSILSAIDKFEAQYQTQIFVRKKSKGLQITASGQRVLSRIRRFLDELETFDSDLNRTNPVIQGELRVGVFVTMAAHLMPHVLQSLHQEYPKLSIHHSEGSLRQVEADLRAGLIDVALTYDAFIPDDLDVVPLLEAPPHALLPANDPLALHETVSIEDLSERPLILLDSPDSAQYVLALFIRAKCRPFVLHRTTSYELIRSSVAFGLGVSVMNIRPITDVAYCGLNVVCRPLSLSAQDLNSRVAVVTRRGDFLGQRARAFISHCQKFASSETAQQLLVK